MPVDAIFQKCFSRVKYSMVDNLMKFFGAALINISAIRIVTLCLFLFNVRVNV